VVLKWLAGKERNWLKFSDYRYMLISLRGRLILTAHRYGKGSCAAICAGITINTHKLEGDPCSDFPTDECDDISEQTLATS
jgi:hypothetical protein